MSRKNNILLFVVASIVFVLLLKGKTNIQCSNLLFFLGPLFLVPFVYGLGIKGAVPVLGFKEKGAKNFYRKCCYSSGLAGIIIGSIAAWVLKLPLAVWLPVMFFLFVGMIFYPPLFYEESSNSYKDVKFIDLFFLSIGISLAILCVLSGAYFHGIISGE